MEDMCFFYCSSHLNELVALSCHVRRNCNSDDGEVD